MTSLADAQQVLREAFGHDAFRGDQADVIQRTLAGVPEHAGHSLVLAPTGSGKSLCYQIPAILLARQGQGTTLVLSPLIALMQDQVAALQKRGVAATFINSTLRRQDRQQRYADLAAGRFDLVYVTPERFRKADFRAALDQARVPLLAVDEAHCVSQWGHDFRPDYSRLDRLRQSLGQPTTLALTATATPDVQQDIIAQLGLTPGPAPHQTRTFHQGIDRPNLRLAVQHVVDDDQKLDAILHAARHPDHTPGSGIVYFSLIKTLDAFADRLLAHRVDHLTYHGGLPRHQRRDTQHAFMANHAPLVLATNAFGMGIDKPDIRFVLHAELPGSLEAYYQEIGRAGRDDKPASATLLYDQRDLATQMEFLRWANPDADFYQRVVHHLQHDADRIHAQGLDFLRTQLHARQGRHDRRLDTALAMLERFGTLAPESNWRSADHPRLILAGELAPELLDQSRLADKLLRDQHKLLALVQYANLHADPALKDDADAPPDPAQASAHHAEFLNRYFAPPTTR